MPRTNATLIGEVIELDPTKSLTQHIAMGAFLTNKFPAVAVDEDDVLIHDEATLTLIETQLAAHFYYMSFQKARTAQVGPIMERFDVKVDMGLQNSEYGQNAMALDISGSLAAYNQGLVGDGVRGKPDVTWLGSDLTEC